MDGGMNNGANGNAGSLQGMNIVLPRQENGGSDIGTNNAANRKMKDASMGVSIGAGGISTRLSGSVNNDVAGPMNYLLGQSQPSGSMIGNNNGNNSHRLLIEPNPTSVGVGGVNLMDGQSAGNTPQLMNNTTTHMSPTFSLPTESNLNGAGAAGGVGTANTNASTNSVTSATAQGQIQTTPALSTGGSTNFQVQIAQRLADIDQRILRMEMMMDNMCNKIESVSQQQSVWKADSQHMETKLMNNINEIKGSVSSIKRTGATQADGGFTAELINAIGNVSNKYMRRSSYGFPSPNLPPNDVNVNVNQTPQPQQPNLSYNIPMNGINAPMAYIPGEQANLNQLGHSKDHIDRFLSKSATDFMLDPTGLKKRKSSPPQEPDIQVAATNNKAQYVNPPLNYSASLPNLNLDALSKDMLPPQQLSVAGTQQTSERGAKFGISSTSHSSSSSSSDYGDAEDEEDETSDRPSKKKRNDVSGVSRSRAAGSTQTAIAGPSNTNPGTSVNNGKSDDQTDVTLKGPKSDKSNSNYKMDPNYAMIKAPSSVMEIWKEYTTGIDGKPSIRSLDQKFGCRWRSTNNRKTYSRRKRMYKFILAGLKAGKTENEMIQILENKRLYKDSHGKQKKHTIGWLQQSLSGS